MSAAEAAGTWKLGDLEVNRIGYGAMRLTGNGMMGNSDGTPIDRNVAVGLLYSAFEQGVNHIDTAARPGARWSRTRFQTANTAAAPACHARIPARPRSRPPPVGTRRARQSGLWAGAMSSYCSRRFNSDCCELPSQLGDHRADLGSPIRTLSPILLAYSVPGGAGGSLVGAEKIAAALNENRINILVADIQR